MSGPGWGLKMAKPRLNARSAAQWVVGIACVACAWGILQIIPAEDSGQAPFAVAVEIDEQGVGRAFEATVTGARLTDELVIDQWRVEANWLVVDLTVSGTMKESGSLLSHTVLVIGDRQYRASERPPKTMLRESVLVGVPRSGILAFELPAEIEAEAQLQLALNADLRLDSMITVDLDLEGLDRVAEHEYSKVGWAIP